MWRFLRIRKASFNPWFNGLMDKDILPSSGSDRIRCFNPWFNGLMDKDSLASGLADAGRTVSTLGLMDWWIKTVKNTAHISMSHCVSTLGLMDWWIKTPGTPGPHPPCDRFNPWFNGLMDKDVIYFLFFSHKISVSTLGLMDWWIKTCIYHHYYQLVKSVSTLGLMDWWIKTPSGWQLAGWLRCFNPWFNGLMDKDNKFFYWFFPAQ